MATKNLGKKMFIWIVVISLLAASLLPIIYSVFPANNNPSIDLEQTEIIINEGDDANAEVTPEEDINNTEEAN